MTRGDFPVLLHLALGVGDGLAEADDALDRALPKYEFGLDCLQTYFDQAKAFAGKKIAQPAAFVFGNADGMIKMRALKREDLAAAVSNLEAFVELDGIGHWPQLEASDAVNEALLGFLHNRKSAA